MSEWEQSMQDLDTTNLAGNELREAIAFHCSQYGTVISVNVLPPIDGRSYALAVVRMANRAEAAALLRNLGHVKFNSTVIIRLGQEASSAAGNA